VTVPAVVRCQVCGGRSRHRLTQTTERRIDFYECSACRLFFAGTDIPDDELAGFYAGIDVERHYDKVAETSRAKAERAVADLGALLGPTACIVDLGCGGGHLLGAVAATGGRWRAVGFDGDADSVALCRAAGFEATTDPGVLPSADAVTMLDIAEHVKAPAELFAQAGRLLSPGGVLYLHTPRRGAWDSAAIAALRLPGASRLGQMWLRTRVSVFHLRLWSDEALQRIAKASGFSVVRYRRELELSWPVEAYVETYLRDKFHLPPLVVRALGRAAAVVVRLRLMRNKAILTARRAF